YRLDHPGVDDGDAAELGLRRFAARHSAFYRYRADLLSREIALQVRCLVGECAEHYEQASLGQKALDRAENQQTRFGWDRPAWEWLTSGEFRSPARFDANKRVDRGRLADLVDAVRGEGITPLFVIMPVHTTFRAVHGPALEQVWTDVETVARERDVPVIHPRLRFEEARNFV